MKKQLTTIVCLLLVMINNGQDRNKMNTKEVFFSASTGFSFAGPDMSEYMRPNGFDDPSWDFFGGGQIQHPFARKYPVYDFRIGYYPNSKFGFAVDYGLIHHLHANGYKGDVGVLGTYSFLKSKLHLASAAFCYRLADKTDLFAGPALLFHRVSEEHSSTGQNTRNTIPAIQIGGTQKLYKGNWWFIALGARYSLAPKSEIGPFAREGEGFTLAASKVNISTLYIGLSAGLRFQQK